MRLGWTPPPPAYPEYERLLEAAQTQARRPVNPATLWLPDHIATRRGDDWATAVIGRPYRGLQSVSSVEAKLIVLADAAGVDPELPQWLADERAETAARQAEQDRRKAEARQREADAWAAAVKACPVPLEVRENTNSRGYGNRAGALCHAVPTADAVSGTRRQHPAGRPLCVTAARRPMPLSEPVDEPATCVRCLGWAGKIRLAGAPS